MLDDVYFIRHVKEKGQWRKSNKTNIKYRKEYTTYRNLVINEMRIVKENIIIKNLVKYN